MWLPNKQNGNCRNFTCTVELNHPIVHMNPANLIKYPIIKYLCRGLYKYYRNTHLIPLMLNNTYNLCFK